MSETHNAILGITLTEASHRLLRFRRTIKLSAHLKQDDICSHFRQSP
jgi:hypothetical protein